MKQRMPFKNLPKVQIKRLHKLRLVKEQEEAKQLAGRQGKKRASRRQG